MTFIQMKKTIQIIVFEFVSLLLIWGISFLSMLCIEGFVLLLSSREDLSDLISLSDLIALLVSVICVIVATKKFWKRYRHVIMPGCDAKHSLHDDNRQSVGVKRALSVTFYLAVIVVIIWAIFVLIGALVYTFSNLDLELSFGWFNFLGDVIPIIIILICDVFVICICIKRLGRG